MLLFNYHLVTQLHCTLRKGLFHFPGFKTMSWFCYFLKVTNLCLKYYEFMDLNLFYKFQVFETAIHTKAQIETSLASIWFLYHFDTTSLIFDSFLAMWYVKMFLAHFLHFLPRHGIRHFSEK